MSDCGTGSTGDAGPESITLVDVYGLLRTACRRAGSQAAWGAQHGISPSFLSAVLNAQRSPSPAMLKALGLRQVVRYARIEQPRDRGTRALQPGAPLA